MTVNYLSLRAENVRRYGTDIGRIGGMLLANRYDKRTHFIYELLQNAEDALRRRRNWKGSRSVAFDLSATELTITHCGEPFDEPDVRGVCGIDESTKDITSIGRFGIGFKSVYAFTARPEVHSGEEAFAIESYVWPVAVSRRDRHIDQTVIVLPLDEDDTEAHGEILEGFQNLGARTLLFLRNVKEISWTVQGKASGLYFRDDPVWHGPNVRELALMGQEEGQQEIEERWLVFSREVHSEEKLVGYIEVAFSLGFDSKEPERRLIQALGDSTLVVFFPTVLPTNTGFLIQGPYRTTPSRDNVPPSDRWNKRLVHETGELLIDALRWLSAKKMLSTGALRCLPLEREKFSGGLLASLFERVVQALKSEPLLPCSDGDYASAADVQLSRTQDLRDLFNQDQLGLLLKSENPKKWLSPEITADRTPALRQYLIHELKLSEQTPELLLPRLTAAFLQAQPDEWIVRLYEFLNKVPALADRLEFVPLVRLEDGVHVTAFFMGQPQVFLPADTETEFPTVRRSVCARPQAKKYLQSLGLTEPDPVDDVIRNLLPKYQKRRLNSEQYAADIARILHAFRTDSAAQKEKLTSSLNVTPFVMAKETGDGSSSLQWPELIYLATARLRDLFRGIPKIYLVDDSYDCLRGEDVRELLEACGTPRYIYPIEVKSDLSELEKHKLRLAKGYVNATHESPLEDYGLRGLTGLLNQLPTLTQEARAKKARLLWEALIELQDRRGQSVFSGTYRWQYHQMRSASFDAHFVRQLNRSAWVPDAGGDLQPPSSVLFDSLGWPPDPFLLSKIHFKKPIVEELAREAGFEPGMLDMLKKLGVTSTAELMARLNLDGLGAQSEAGRPKSKEARRSSESVEEIVGDREGEPDEDEPLDEALPEPEADSARNGQGSRDPGRAGDTDGRVGDGGARHEGHGGVHRTNNDRGERTFVSYVAIHPVSDDEEGDSEGVDQAERLALEKRAIELIRNHEPLLKVMPAGNKGFDLVETDANDEPERWIEVKAMKGSLEDRPVGLSSVQFEFARQHGEQYWLYVVEYAGDAARSRIVKIENPAGRAGTFTFDKGWISIADVDGPPQTSPRG